MSYVQKRKPVIKFEFFLQSSLPWQQDNCYADPATYYYIC
jgi:hypothetical protein